MVRAAALSLLILFSVAVMLPLAQSARDYDRPSFSHHRKKRIRRHSRAWWRRYRAHLRRKRAQLTREKTLNALREHKPDTTTLSAGRAPAVASPNVFTATGGVYTDPRGAFSLTMPRGWSSRPQMANGEMKFMVYGPDGRPSGQATLSVFSTATPMSTLPMRMQRRMIGGVPLADLRRTVINKMIATGGWVVNDLEREFNGRRVFIVLAQVGASTDGRAPQQSWTFYFTEMDGRVYSFATSAPLDFSDRMAVESEQVMASFRTGSQPSTQTETSLR